MFLGLGWFNVVFSKRRKEWITKKIYAPKTSNFRQELMDHLKDRINHQVTDDSIVLPHMSTNIGEKHCPKPDKNVAVASLVSRF